MAKILVAASPEARVVVERLLAGHELCCAETMAQAEQFLRELWKLSSRQQGKKRYSFPIDVGIPTHSARGFRSRLEVRLPKRYLPTESSRSGRPTYF